nr:EOG090X0ACU [Macrothrix elegans]
MNLPRTFRNIFMIAVKKEFLFFPAINNQQWRTISTPASHTHATPVPISKPKSERNKPRHIVDLREVRIIAGKGGDGCISLRREAKNPMAGPDGGDGGNGGHVTFRATSNKNSLDHIDTIVKADDGVNGANQDCDGSNAKHLVIDVPIGTLFKSKDGRISASLDQEGAVFIAARGGAGGKGNRFFTTDVNQAPEIAEYGAAGEEIAYTIELRTIADVGLIGIPNAGKSSFLRAISRARPKVAPYPFTTLQPHLGIVKYDDLVQTNWPSLKNIGILPDILEEGCRRNFNLGLWFCIHMDRIVLPKFLMFSLYFCIWNILTKLRIWLKCYSRNISNKYLINADNKIDVDVAKISGTIKHVTDRFWSGTICVAAVKTAQVKIVVAKDNNQNNTEVLKLFRVAASKKKAFR